MVAFGWSQGKRVEKKCCCYYVHLPAHSKWSVQQNNNNMQREKIKAEAVPSWFGIQSLSRRLKLTRFDLYYQPVCDMVFFQLLKFVPSSLVFLGKCCSRTRLSGLDEVKVGQNSPNVCRKLFSKKKNIPALTFPVKQCSSLKQACLISKRHWDFWADTSILNYYLGCKNVSGSNSGNRIHL